MRSWSPLCDEWALSCREADLKFHTEFIGEQRMISMRLGAHPAWFPNNLRPVPLARYPRSFSRRDWIFLPVEHGDISTSSPGQYQLLAGALNPSPPV